MTTTQQAVRIRADIAAMDAYTPTTSLDVFAAQLGRSAGGLIKLDANENPYGPSPRVREALAALDVIHIYPDPEARRLRAALSEYVGVDSGHLLVGAGSDELIVLLLQLFVEPGDAILNCPPTFGMYAFDAPLAHARVVNVPRREDFSLNVDGIEAAALKSGAKLLFLCTPNNPDGSLIPDDVIARLLDLPLVVVLDEAYSEFSGVPSWAARVPEIPNLVVLRTFSKWAGLAGLRVGYGVFPEAILTHLRKIKQPYNLNVAAEAGARAALADRAGLESTVRRIVAERDRLARELGAFPFLTPFPSAANFVLVRVSGFPAGALRQRLADEHGILVRHFDKPGLSDCLRISAGTPQHTDALLAALRVLAPEVP